jgi:hypothetical protein
LPRRPPSAADVLRRKLADRPDIRQAKPVIASTPAVIEHAFAQRGIALATASTSRELCDRRECVGLDVWGGGKVTFLVPQHGKTDFEVVLFRTQADALRSKSLFGPNRPVVALRWRSALLLYLRSSPRLALIRAAFASLG